MIILYILLIGASLWLGISLSNKYILRFKFYEDMLCFLNKYLTNLNYRKDSISDLFINFNNEKKGDFSRYLLNLGDKDNFSVEYLNKNELTEIYFNISSLGSADETTEEIKVKEIINSTTDIVIKTKKEKEKFVGLYIKIGLLLGLLLAILLI